MTFICKCYLSLRLTYAFKGKKERTIMAYISYTGKYDPFKKSLKIHNLKSDHITLS